MQTASRTDTPTPTTAASAEVGKRFSDAAPQYEAHARVQQDVATWLAQWCMPSDAPVHRVLELGCGTGFLTGHLLQQFPQSVITALDIAPGMVHACQTRLNHPRLHCVFADAELHVPKQAHEWVVSSMTIQWFKDWAKSLTHHLTHARTVCVSLLLDTSFEAWRQAHQHEGLAAGLQALPEPTQVDHVLDTLRKTYPGLQIACEQARFEQHLPNGLAFAQSLRNIGADTARMGHSPIPLRKVLRHFENGIAVNYDVARLKLTRQD